MWQSLTPWKCSWPLQWNRQVTESCTNQVSSLPRYWYLDHQKGCANKKTWVLHKESPCFIFSSAMCPAGVKIRTSVHCAWQFYHGWLISCCGQDMSRVGWHLSAAQKSMTNACLQHVYPKWKLCRTIYASMSMVRLRNDWSTIDLPMCREKTVWSDFFQPRWHYLLVD